MVKAVGIDIGDYAVKAVELDGSYRKTRLLRHRIESSPASDGDAAVRSELVAETVLRALTEGKIGRSDLRLGYPSREAVLRTVEVPFSGNDAIRKVIKSEVEGAIHSQSVDDMVVDFHVVGKAAEGTRVLVAAVPKPGLRSLLDALEEVGLEPENIDLDTMALYRVADWCGVFARPEPDAAPGEEPLPVPLAGAVAKPVRIAVLDLGSRATRVLLVEDGRLVEMRVLRVGDAAIAEDIAKRHGLPAPLARQAVVACLSTGNDFAAEVAEQLPVPAVEGAAVAPAAVPARSAVVTHAEVEAAQTGWLQRLSRELVRFLVSVGERGKVQDLFVTGGASTTPGMQELLREVFAVEPRPLDVIGHLQHDLPPEEAAALGPHIAIAVGLALAPFGGPEGFQLRQEDLAYARGFDRVKFPLAIFCMVAIFAGLVWIVKLNNDLKGQELILGRTYDDTQKKPVFFGMVYSLLSDKSWFNDSRYFEAPVYNKLLDDVRKAPVAERVRLIRNKLSEVAKAKQRESGQFEDLTLESGLAVLVRFAELMKSKESELGRFLIHEINLSIGTGQSRTLEFTISFRSDATTGFRVRANAMKSAIEAEIARPDSPCFKKLVESHEDLFTDSDTSGVEGVYYKVRIELRDVIPPFGGMK